MSSGGGSSSALLSVGVGGSTRDWSKESKLARVFKNDPQVTIAKKIKALLAFYSQTRTQTHAPQPAHRQPQQRAFGIDTTQRGIDSGG